MTEQELKDKIREYATEGMEDFDDYDTEEKAAHAVDKILQREFKISELYKWAEKVVEAHEHSKVKEERINEYKKKIVDAHLNSLIPEDRKALMSMYFEKIDGKIPDYDDILDDSSFVDFVLSGGGFVNSDWYEEAIKDKAQAT